jgi:hypothetical protein
MTEIDDEDAVWIARLTAQFALLCARAGRGDLGPVAAPGGAAGALIVEAVSQVQQMRDLLGCV